jgi:hypothetical protein
MYNIYLGVFTWKEKKNMFLGTADTVPHLVFTLLHYLKKGKALLPTKL